MDKFSSSDNRDSTFKIWIGSNHFYPANIPTFGYVKKLFKSSATVVEIEVTFYEKFWEIGREKLGMKT